MKFQKLTFFCSLLLLFTSHALVQTAHAADPSSLIQSTIEDDHLRKIHVSLQSRELIKLAQSANNGTLHYTLPNKITLLAGEKMLLALDLNSSLYQGRLDQAAWEKDRTLSSNQILSYEDDQSEWHFLGNTFYHFQTHTPGLVNIPYRIKNIKGKYGFDADSLTFDMAVSIPVEVVDPQTSQ